MPRKLLKKKKKKGQLDFAHVHCTCAILSFHHQTHFIRFSFHFGKTNFVWACVENIWTHQKNYSPSPLYIKQHSFPFSLLFFFFCSFHPSYFTSYQTHPKIAFIIVSFSYASMCHLMSNHCTLHCDGSSLFSKVTKV